MPHAFNSGLKRPSSTSYLNCPLKKRPLKYDPEVIIDTSNKEVMLNEPENLSTKPEDLRLKKSSVAPLEEYNWTAQKGPLEPISQNQSPPWLSSHHHNHQPVYHPSSIRSYHHNHHPAESRVSQFTPIINNYCAHRDSPPHISPPLSYEPAYPVIRIEENHYQSPLNIEYHQSVTHHQTLQNQQQQQNQKIENNNNNVVEKEGVIRYQCPDCSKSYSTFSGLSKHVQFHCSSQNKKSFVCKFCEKVYVSLGALKMHIRTHTLPCKCTICGKAFSRPWLLQGHIRTHTGEKPFTCQHCNRAFADRSNLRAHLQTHSEVKKYSCKSCSKTFSRMSLLVKHEEANCQVTSDIKYDSFINSE